MPDQKSPAELARKLRAAADSLHSSIPSPHMEQTMRDAADFMELMATPVPHAADDRYAFKNENVAGQLRSMALDIVEELPQGWGFALYLFEYGEGGGLFYMSSAARADVARVMQEWLRREGQGLGRPL